MLFAWGFQVVLCADICRSLPSGVGRKHRIAIPMSRSDTAYFSLLSFFLLSFSFLLRSSGCPVVVNVCRRPEHGVRKYLTYLGTYLPGSWAAGLLAELASHYSGGRHMRRISKTGGGTAECQPRTAMHEISFYNIAPNHGVSECTLIPVHGMQAARLQSSSQYSLATVSIDL